MSFCTWYNTTYLLHETIYFKLFFSLQHPFFLFGKFLLKLHFLFILPLFAQAVTFWLLSLFPFLGSFGGCYYLLFFLVKQIFTSAKNIANFKLSTGVLALNISLQPVQVQGWCFKRKSKVLFPQQFSGNPTLFGELVHINVSWPRSDSSTFLLLCKVTAVGHTDTRQSFECSRQFG